jgi:sodium-dependent dicarboxylate transporter 2/3/5
MPEVVNQQHHRSAAGLEAGIRILLVDDEDRFRHSLASRLSIRGLQVEEVADGAEAVRLVRQRRPDVVLLDRKMPGLQGEAVLAQIKEIAPEVQVVILTGHATIPSATETGRLDAFAYLEKPCETETLLETIAAAYQEKLHALARREMVQLEGRSTIGWLRGTHNFRPGVLILGAVLFGILILTPAPPGLLRLLSTPCQAGALPDPTAGYAEHRKLRPGQTVGEYYLHHAGFEVAAPGDERDAVRAARQAKVMVGVLLVAALFWATGALPVGFTALLVGVLMIIFRVLQPDQVAAAYAKDAVFFIAGVLALSAGIARTGLDRRIGLLLLWTSRSPGAFLFLFLPLLAVTAAFLSEHALVAFITPILMMVYVTSIRQSGLTRDRSLAVMLILGLCFAANHGGPGSPAAGGRNAVMIGILADYDLAPTFGQWVLYGLPFVPVMSLVIATYFYVRLGRSLQVSNLDAASIVRQEARRIGPMTRTEYLTAVVLVGIILLWVTASDTLGMGGPVLLGLVALAMLRIITWKDINGISWDVVALYAGACAMGKGLAVTGAALWMADCFVSVLPECLRSGEGLCVAVSVFTGTLTNIMSDGATVSAIGPVAVPMAQISGTHPWMVGFAAAFASSFANLLIIGTPNNAIAYSLAKDPQTGEQLVTLGDFLKHGIVISILAFLVLWGWAFFGYWKWIGF